MRNIAARRGLVGESLLVIGCAHLALGATRYNDEFRSMFRDGYVGALELPSLAPDERVRRQRAFWFEMTGGALLVLGGSTRSLERRGLQPPRGLGWSLAALAAAGGAAVPVSGFWALLVPAGLVLLRRRSTSGSA